jgi:hypothetical protein
VPGRASPRRVPGVALLARDAIRGRRTHLPRDRRMAPRSGAGPCRHTFLAHQRPFPGLCREPASARGLHDGLPMTWEKRLREMILAGGAVAATACTTSNSVSSSDAASNVDYDASNSCCNASSDPCCYLSCVPDATPSGSCLQEIDCVSEGGMWDSFSFSCASREDAAPPDATPGPADAGPGDAPDDTSFVFPCCNANSDPCCPIAYCAGGGGPDAAVYVDCEQSRSQCEMANGSYEPQPDGSLGCTR